MDSSDQVFQEEEEAEEAVEECTSNESGWTMYIDGEEHDDGDLSDDGEDNEDEGNDSDDSMLSDASSGPSHLQELPLGKVDDGGHGTASFNNNNNNNNKDDYDTKYYSYNKPKRVQMEKKSGQKRNIKLEIKEEEASELVVNSSTSSVLSGTKLRKNSWMSNKGN